ncbi:hypothetical protein HG531_008355 [Fusarium graminearum]|nr:hypothetical protein HG531_008355 [Fusarium graminearum]
MKTPNIAPTIIPPIAPSDSPIFLGSGSASAVAVEEDSSASVVVELESDERGRSTPVTVDMIGSGNFCPS